MVDVMLDYFLYTLNVNVLVRSLALVH